MSISKKWLEEGLVLSTLLKAQLTIRDMHSRSSNFHLCKCVDLEQLISIIIVWLRVQYGINSTSNKQWQGY